MSIKHHFDCFSVFLNIIGKLGGVKCVGSGSATQAMIYYGFVCVKTFKHSKKEYM